MWICFIAWFPRNFPSHHPSDHICHINCRVNHVEGYVFARKSSSTVPSIPIQNPTQNSEEDDDDDSVSDCDSWVRVKTCKLIDSTDVRAKEKKIQRKTRQRRKTMRPISVDSASRASGMSENQQKRAAHLHWLIADNWFFLLSVPGFCFCSTSALIFPFPLPAPSLSRQSAKYYRAIRFNFSNFSTWWRGEWSEALHDTMKPKSSFSFSFSFQIDSFKESRVISVQQRRKPDDGWSGLVVGFGHCLNKFALIC